MIWQQLIGRSYIVTEFDDDLVKNTKSFQEAHKLEIDGIVGKNSWIEGFKQI